MKKLIFSVVLCCSMSICYSQVLKVSANGRVNINNVEVTNSPYDYYFLVKAYNILFSSDNGDHYLRFQLGTSSPRLSGTNHCVVFYDGISSEYNDIQVKNLYQYSDKFAKTNITTLSNALGIVNKLNPVKFNWKPKESMQRTKLSADSLGIGFLAQEIEAVLPNIVKKDDEGNKLVNYIAIVPVLTQAIKELKAEVDFLKKDIAKKEMSLFIANEEKSINNKNKTIDNSEVNAILYQNMPNPFSQSTQIKYYIPESVNQAFLCIYDLQGKQLKQFMLTVRGQGVETITGSEFNPGIYLYGLITDGKEVDMKRMILTE